MFGELIIRISAITNISVSENSKVVLLCNGTGRVQEWFFNNSTLPDIIFDANNNVPYATFSNDAKSIGVLVNLTRDINGYNFSSILIPNFTSSLTIICRTKAINSTSSDVDVIYYLSTSGLSQYCQFYSSVLASGFPKGTVHFGSVHLPFS